MLTSRLIKRELKAEYGQQWRVVADDLDNAIAEYGGWVDGKIHDRIEAYVEELRQRNREIKDVTAWAKPDHEWMRCLVDEEVQYWVHGKVRRYFGAAGATAGGALTIGRTGYMEKLGPATYDSLIDFDFTVRYEAEIIEVWPD